MAIPISNVTRRAVYAPSGAGGVGPYAFTFEILANTDIAVFKDNTLLTLTTHYTVTINANGTGTVAIRASGNVTSITDNGTGDYTVNFTTAMTDANYAVTGTQSSDNETSANNPVQGPATVDYSTGSFRVYTGSNTSTKQDNVRVCLAAIR